MTIDGLCCAYFAAAIQTITDGAPLLEALELSSGWHSLDRKDLVSVSIQPWNASCAYIIKQISSSPRFGAFRMLRTITINIVKPVPPPSAVKYNLCALAYTLRESYPSLEVLKLSFDESSFPRQAQYSWRVTLYDKFQIGEGTNKMDCTASGKQV